MREVGFALVGCGSIARKHAEAVAAADGARLVAVCDTKEERMQPYIERYGARGCRAFEEILNDSAVDVINIAVPSGLHAALGVEAARAGKHLIMEKPLALSLADADQLIDAAAAAGVALSVVHPNRYKPGVTALKRALDRGKFGRLTHGSAVVRWNRNEQYYAQAPWRGRKEHDGGVLLNQAIHNIDLLQWMLGPVQEVFAYTARRLRSIDTEDTGVAALRFQNGALGTVEAAVTLYPGNLEETLAVFGETGTAVLGGVHVGRILTWRVSGWDEAAAAELIQAVEKDPEGKPGHQVIVEGMVRAVREGTPPPVDGTEARRSLEIILAIYRSAATGRPVSLPLTEA